MKKYIRITPAVIISLFFIQDIMSANTTKWSVSSPDQKVLLSIEKGQDNALSYHIEYDKKTAVEPSRLGVIMNGTDIGKSPVFISASTPRVIKENLELKVGKQ